MGIEKKNRGFGLNISDIIGVRNNISESEEVR